MNKEIQNFLDAFTDSLLESKKNNESFEKRFKDSVAQTASSFTKEELVEILSYILIDFNKAETEMIKEIDRHANKTKST